MGPLNKTFTAINRAKKQKMQPIRPGEYFAPQSWQQRWFTLRIPTAKPAERGRRHLHWQANGETTVYIDSKPWAGLDVAHARCPLPDKARQLWLDTGTYQTGIWIRNTPRIDGNGCRFDSASLELRDESAWEASHDLDVLLQLTRFHLRKLDRTQQGATFHPSIDDCPPFLRRLLKRLDDSIDRFATGGVSSLLPILKDIYNEFPAESWGVKTGITGHAHMDLVWLWPEKVTYRKTVHTYATMLRLMERYPEVIFSMSQPVLLDRMKADAPEQYRDILNHMRTSRWEATGGFDVETDTQIPSGEGLARALVYGQERFRKLKGSYSTTGWLPDVFGYNQFLPQLFSLAGVSNFFTTKMTWSAITRFPHNSFVWEGPDGSQVLTHLAPMGYNGQATVAETIGGMDAYRQSDVHGDRLAPTGHGDGAGGLTEEHCERARRLKSLATVPKVEWTRAEDFFDGLEQVRDQLPVYRGELYLEYHRGTYTTQSQLKYQYRRAEGALRSYEAARVVTGGRPVERELWHRLIFTQFHDSLPGSSIRVVYDDLVPELEQIGTRALDAAARTIEGTSRKRGVTVFNPLAMPLNTVVHIPLSKPGGSQPVAVTDQDGKLLPLQIDEEGKTAMIAMRLGGLESRYLKISKRSQPTTDTPSSAIYASARRLTNGIVDARFDRSGQLDVLTISGVPLHLSGKAGFCLHEDNPAAFDAWDIDHSATWLHKAAADRMKLKVVERGPARAALRGEAPVGEASRMVVTFSLDKGSSLLKIAVDVDWRESHKLLRYRVPTDSRGVMARFGNPFGHIDRNQKTGVHRDEAQWEVPASRWMAVLDAQGQGLSIIAEAKYGFSCRDGVAGVSLLRSPKSPDYAADMGRHDIRFAIGKYRATSSEDDLSTAAETEAAYTSPVVVKGNHQKPVPFALTGLDGVVPAWVLPSERGRGYIIRAHDAAGVQGQFDIQFTRAPKQIGLVDFLERPMEGGVEKVDARCYRILCRANQIVSIKVRV